VSSSIMSTWVEAVATRTPSQIPAWWLAAARFAAVDLRSIDVRINIAERWLVTCVFPVQHSARWRLDNCYRDQAVTNAAQLADLLSRADVPVVSPSG